MIVGICIGDVFILTNVKIVELMKNNTCLRKSHIV